ncbi:PASTA domain-containing protein [Specibacter sp. NPDC078709]|uniref:PASTA domain-containing protein n=1 Tax=unclassified Specibacter TaxID=3081321 RepID=UPI0034321C10
MVQRRTVAVPDLVGQPVHIAEEMAANLGLLLSSGDPDGQGLHSRTWPGLFWVTAQDPSVGSFLEWGSDIRITFMKDGQARSDVPAQPSGPAPTLKNHADDAADPDRDS